MAEDRTTCDCLAEAMEPRRVLNSGTAEGVSFFPQLTRERPCREMPVEDYHQSQSSKNTLLYLYMYNHTPFSLGRLVWSTDTRPSINRTSSFWPPFVPHRPYLLSSSGRGPAEKFQVKATTNPTLPQTQFLPCTWTLFSMGWIWVPRTWGHEEISQPNQFTVAGSRAPRIMFPRLTWERPRREINSMWRPLPVPFFQKHTFCLVLGPPWVGTWVPRKWGHQSTESVHCGRPCAPQTVFLQLTWERPRREVLTIPLFQKLFFCLVLGSPSLWVDP